MCIPCIKLATACYSVVDLCTCTIKVASSRNRVSVAQSTVVSNHLVSDIPNNRLSTHGLEEMCNSFYNDCLVAIVYNSRFQSCTCITIMIVG